MGNVTQNTQEFDGIEEGALANGTKLPDVNIWGRFLSVNHLFPLIELINDEYSFGRGKTCSVLWNSDELQMSKYFLAYSSTHFKIIRDKVQNYAYIEDLSSNGTYINGEKIGKNKRCVLGNNAEIAIASRTHRAYVYIDPTANDDLTIPAVVREKYIVSKQIGRGAYGEVKLCFLRGKDIRGKSADCRANDFASSKHLHSRHL